MVLAANGENKLHRSAEKVLKKVGEKRSLVDTVQRCQKKWLGRKLRSDSWPRTITEGTGMLGKRPRARKRSNA